MTSNSPSTHPTSDYLFISYAHENGTVVDQLCADLDRAGIEYWRDRIKLKVGMRNWLREASNAIKGARGFVLIATPEARQSDAVHEEIAIADALGKPIYPLWAGGDNYWAECILVVKCLRLQ